MDDIFRGFFGLRRPTPSPRDGHHSDSHHEHELFEPRHGGLDDMFEHFHRDMFHQMESLHRQMEDMMKGFGAVDFPSDFDSHGAVPEDPHKDDSSKKIFVWSSPSPFFRQGPHSSDTSPRDFMLKDDEGGHADPKDASPKDKMFSLPSVEGYGSVKREDSDLDGKVSDEKLIDLIKRGKNDPLPNPSPPHARVERPRGFFSGQSVSVSTIRGPDGKVEQKRTVRDSSGREESTITRSLGDRSHTVTTITDDAGGQEKHEKLHNMDEHDLSKFEELWSQKQQDAALSPGDSMRRPDALPSLPLDPNDQGLFFRLFGRGGR